MNACLAILDISRENQLILHYDMGNWFLPLGLGRAGMALLAALSVANFLRAAQHGCHFPLGKN